MVRCLGTEPSLVFKWANPISRLVNTYPGCGCDVASHFYSYSFALNPDWSQKFSMRPEIQAYFRDVAEQ